MNFAEEILRLERAAEQGRRELGALVVQTIELANNVRAETQLVLEENKQLRQRIVELEASR